MTLRERLVALADSAEGCVSSISRGIAIKAARMALEEAGFCCDAVGHARWSAKRAGFNCAMDCKDTIRALRDGLE